MPKTEKLRSYVEAMKDHKRELRAELVEVLQEEDAVSRASGGNAADLTKKFNMEGMGN